jgi:predicted enzyme related to lactoylglutathione lyase
VVVTPITEIPDVVTRAEFRDPAGNLIGISLADS